MNSGRAIQKSGFALISLVFIYVHRLFSSIFMSFSFYPKSIGYGFRGILDIESGGYCHHIGYGLRGLLDIASYCNLVIGCMS